MRLRQGLRVSVGLLRVEVLPSVARHWVLRLLEVQAFWVGRLRRAEVGPSVGHPSLAVAVLWAGHLRQRLALRVTQSLAQHWVAVGPLAVAQKLAWGSLPIRVGLA